MPAPKRKRPRLLKHDNENRPASPAKPDTAEPPSRPEVLPVARSDSKTPVSAVAESGASTTAPATVGAQQEVARELEKRGEDHRGRDPELRASEPDRRDHGPESQSRVEPPAPPVKPGGEAAAAAPVGSEARNGEATTATRRWAIWIFFILLVL